MEDRGRRRRSSSLSSPTLLLLCIVLVAVAAPSSPLAAADGDEQHGACTGGKKEQQQLWVFGDSYADTGNLGDLGRELTHAWYDPYGRTFPRRPSGRFSDGRVLTDYVASAMGMPTPVAYKVRRGAPRGLLARGMNFAVGGSGVLDTGYLQRNLSAQIDLFQAQHHRPAAGRCNATAVALVVVSGNDYAYVADKDNNTGAAIAYIPTVVRRLREQLVRLRDDAGMRKVVVTNLHPMGCTPLFTRPLNYSGCDPLANAGAAQHNAALRGVITALDPRNRAFLLLDVNTPIAAMVQPSSSDDDSGDGERRFPARLRPCCESSTPDGYCGQQDDAGARQYALCDDPAKHVYWDDVHPTQAAWAAVADTFRDSLHSFLLST